MSEPQNFPMVGGPWVDARGNPTQAFLAFCRALFNRTGQGAGISADDLQVALIEAAQAVGGPVDYTEPEAFALMVSGGSGRTFWAQDEGSSLTSELATLNFTGGGITASLTSAGVVQVNVPTGAGGVTSVGIASPGGTITVTGSPIVGSGVIDIDLTSTAVTPGTYGDATHVGQFTVDAKGRLTFAQNVAISATSSTAYAPMSNGAEPPSIVDNGAGEFVMVPYTP